MGLYIRKSKKYDLLLKIAILGSKSGFLFIAFLDSYLVITIGLIQLGKIFSLI